MRSGRSLFVRDCVFFRTEASQLDTFTNQQTDQTHCGFRNATWNRTHHWGCRFVKPLQSKRLLLDFRKPNSVLILNLECYQKMGGDKSLEAEPDGPHQIISKQTVVLNK